MFNHRRAMLYALPVFFLAIMIGPAGSIIQGIYTREFGVSLSAIATAIATCRILDALTDPVVGLLADRTRHWPGGRKFWVVAGAALLLCGAYFLFLPRAGGITSAYFFGAYFITLLGWTVVEVSHLSWGAELSRSYDDRARIFSYRTGFLFAGTLVFLALPLVLAMRSAPSVTALFAAEYNSATLSTAFTLIAILFPVAIWLTTRYCPQGEARGGDHRVSPRVVWQALRGNRPFQLFALMVSLFFIGNGMQVALAYLHLSSYLQLGPQAPLIYVLCFPLNLLTIPLWLRLTRRYEKSTVLALGVGGSALLFIAIGLIRPGPSAFLEYLLVFAALQAFQPAWQILPPAILGDIADYAAWRNGADQTATMYALYAFLYKAISGLGAALGFALAGAFGFDPAHNVHDAMASWGIVLAMAFLPAVLTTGAALVAWRLPLGRRRHAAVQRALARRAAAAQDLSERSVPC